MAEVHFADVPGHVARRESDVNSCGDAFVVNRVDVFDPDRHPDALIGFVVTVYLKGGGVGSLAAATLCAVAEENLTFAGTDRAEGRRRSPVPAFFFQPHFSNQAKVARMSETFRIGVRPLASIAPQDSTIIKFRLQKKNGSPRLMAEAHSQGFWGYNHRQLCLSFRVQDSGPTKSVRHWARAEWAKCIARGIRVWSARSRSRFCRSSFRMILSASSDSSAKPRPSPA